MMITGRYDDDIVLLMMTMMKFYHCFRYTIRQEYMVRMTSEHLVDIFTWLMCSTDRTSWI